MIQPLHRVAVVVLYIDISACGGAVLSVGGWVANWLTDGQANVLFGAN